MPISSSRVGLWHIYQAARVTVVSGYSRASTLHDPMCSALRFLPMKSKSGAYVPANVHRFVAADLRAHWLTATVAPIDANSASVAADAYWHPDALQC
jgi:hypothetical protein